MIKVDHIWISYRLISSSILISQTLSLFAIVMMERSQCKRTTQTATDETHDEERCSNITSRCYHTSKMLPLNIPWATSLEPFILSFELLEITEVDSWPLLSATRCYKKHYSR